MTENASASLCVGNARCERARGRNQFFMARLTSGSELMCRKPDEHDEKQAEQTTMATNDAGGPNRVFVPGPFVLVSHRQTDSMLLLLCYDILCCDVRRFFGFGLTRNVR